MTENKKTTGVWGKVKTPDVSEKSLTTYGAYLERHLGSPLRVQASEEFDWEEPYLVPGSDSDEYRKLRTNQPSHLDVFLLTAIPKTPDAASGLIAQVTREGDDKQFVVPLHLFEAVDPTSADFEVLKEYTIWFLMYG